MVRGGPADRHHVPGAAPLGESPMRRSTEAKTNAPGGRLRRVVSSPARTRAVRCPRAN